MRKPKVVLNNWYSLAEPVTPYQAPEVQGRPRLGGDVVGHPNHKDGHHVNTSRIVQYTLKLRDGLIVETDNTLYLLDGICPKYKAWCDENGYKVKA
jgi:hypothetical protein|tara:strand:+ start:197 stop:484 length:288 start_codon:yes stop_codon:yes gene_type:complete